MVRACKGKAIRLSSSLIISSFNPCQNYSILFFFFNKLTELSLCARNCAVSHCLFPAFLYTHMATYTHTRVHIHMHTAKVSELKHQISRGQEKIHPSEHCICSHAVITPDTNLKHLAPVTGRRITAWAAVDPASRGVLSTVGTGPPLSLWRPLILTPLDICPARDAWGSWQPPHCLPSPR